MQKQHVRLQRQRELGFNEKKTKQTKKNKCVLHLSPNHREIQQGKQKIIASTDT